ncbi:hypothetical protein [Helicobacter felis]|uniref:hypothetical protein n=1 Tax=Helicobacter felis TaxID=214 RepID=UPI000CEEB447|nr:hypothetical protein [Helicobacter felis]
MLIFTKIPFNPILQRVAITSVRGQTQGQILSFEVATNDMLKKWRRSRSDEMDIYRFEEVKILYVNIA